jgi:glycosyltransferase involved in cell wall biosynthesis
MKIGIFLPNATFDQPGTPEVGGIETFAYTVGEAMQRLGHEVVLFGGEPKAGRSHRETTLKLRLFPYWETKSIPDIGTRFQRLVQRVHFGWTSRDAWLDEHFDAALLAKPFDWPVAWWWKRRQPLLKVVMGFHGTDFFKGDLTFYKAVDHAFAVSPVVATLAEKHVGAGPELIPNPTDVDFFTPGDVSVPSISEPIQLAASGRLIGWKGFDRLVSAVMRMHARGIIVKCTLAGDGPEYRHLQNQISQGYLNSYFTLAGRLDRAQLRELLRHSDAYVAPSVGLEAFSIAALEAASVGLPLVLSDQVGLSDFLSQEDFMRYPAEDVGALERTIEALISRRKEAAWIDRGARHERIRASFSPDVVAKKLIALIQGD